MWQKKKLLLLSNFFFCHYVFKKPSAAEASDSDKVRERVKIFPRRLQRRQKAIKWGKAWRYFQSCPLWKVLRNLWINWKLGTLICCNRLLVITVWLYFVWLMSLLDSAYLNLLWIIWLWKDNYYEYIIRINIFTFSPNVFFKFIFCKGINILWISYIVCVFRKGLTLFHMQMYFDIICRRQLLINIELARSWNAHNEQFFI